MKRLTILLIVITALFYSCNSNSDKKEDIEVVKTQYVEQEKAFDTESDEKEISQVLDCVRAQAESIVIRDIYPNTIFNLQLDSLTAIETIYIDIANKVVINNWGCEYYVLSFQFETTKYNADTTAMKYWYVNSCKLMNEIIHGIDAPIDLEKGLQAFNDHISKNVFDLELKTEIDYGENEIRNFVSLDNIS